LEQDYVPPLPQSLTQSGLGIHCSYRAYGQVDAGTPDRLSSHVDLLSILANGSCVANQRWRLGPGSGGCRLERTDASLRVLGLRPAERCNSVRIVWPLVPRGMGRRGVPAQMTRILPLW